VWINLLTFETNCVVDDDVYSDVNNNYLIFADRNIYCNGLFKATKSFNVIVNTYLRHRKVRRKFCDSLRPNLRWWHVRFVSWIACEVAKSFATTFALVARATAVCDLSWIGLQFCNRQSWKRQTTAIWQSTLSWQQRYAARRRAGKRWSGRRGRKYDLIEHVFPVRSAMVANHSAARVQSSSCNDIGVGRRALPNDMLVLKTATCVPSSAEQGVVCLRHKKWTCTTWKHSI